jgi:hypothetical protein
MHAIVRLLRVVQPTDLMSATKHRNKTHCRLAGSTDQARSRQAGS